MNISFSSLKAVAYQEMDAARTDQFKRQALEQFGSAIGTVSCIDVATGHYGSQCAAVVTYNDRDKSRHFVLFPSTKNQGRATVRVGTTIVWEGEPFLAYKIPGLYMFQYEIADPRDVFRPILVTSDFVVDDVLYKETTVWLLSSSWMWIPANISEPCNPSRGASLCTIVIDESVALLPPNSIGASVFHFDSTHGRVRVIGMCVQNIGEFESTNDDGDTVRQSRFIVAPLFRS